MRIHNDMWNRFRLIIFLFPAEKSVIGEDRYYINMFYNGRNCVIPSVEDILYNLNTYYGIVLALEEFVEIVKGFNGYSYITYPKNPDHPYSYTEPSTYVAFKTKEDIENFIESIQSFMSLSA